jgi:undecaprenyl-diphosphatase
MLEKILEYERGLFFLLNGSDSPTMDRFMWLVSNTWVWIPWAACLLIVIFYKKNWKEALFVIFAIALVITICDQVSASLIKPYFARFRPTHHPDFMDEVKTVFGYRGGRYGFVSSHAANAFGCAIFTILLFRNKFFTFTMLTFALLNAYSRVYLGVHFISDVVGGAIVGVLAGFICYYFYVTVRKCFLKIPASELKISRYTTKEKNIISLFFWITIICILLFNNQLVILFLGENMS